MDLARITRRSLVVTGVAVGLMVGTVAIRTAADWTAAAANTGEPPSGISELQARIDVERTRSARIRSQIERLADGSDRLADVIAMANAMAQRDEAAADELTSDLTQAKEALDAMTPAPEPTPAPTPAPVRRTTTTTTTTTTVAAPTPTPTYHDDDHHDGGHDD